MGENGAGLHNGSSNGATNGGSGDMANGDAKNHHHSSKHKIKDQHRKETEEERRIRKEKERKEREERYRKEGKRPETEEERRIRKEKERREREERHKKEGKREETEEERRIRKEKERREREDKHKKEGKAEETEEERRIRKEKERKEREERYRREGKRPETEEERRIRKEKERRDGKHKESSSRSRETEEERRMRKEREGNRQPKQEPIEDEDEVKQEAPDGNEDDSQGSNFANNDEDSTDIKDEPLDEDMDDGDQAHAHNNSKSRSAKKRKNYNDGHDEDEDEQDDYKPQSKRKKESHKHHHHSKVKEEEEDDDDYGQNDEEEAAASDPDDDEEYQDEDEDFKSSSKKSKAKKATPSKSSSKASKKTPSAKKGSKAAKVETKPPVTAKGGRAKGKDEAGKKDQPEVWKWWEEEKKDDGTKWRFLEHKGPLFAPLYVRLPENVRFYYDGKVMRLSEEAEEVATFYGRMLDHDYTTKEVFNKNFFKDWRKVMMEKEKEKIRDLSKCDFTEIDAYFKKVSEERKARDKEERKAEKEKNDQIQKEYGFCAIDGHKEKIGNFRIEPPGLFRGRGEHPKQGMLKRRVQPEDVIINCSKDSRIPEPPEGHRWKEVRHDNSVTWLACWTENVQSQIKYVMLNPSSKLKGEKDMLKYEKARQLKDRIAKIRDDYVTDFKSKEMRIRQRAVALYFIDKLALRAGNEKDEDQADTVGCCSLRVEHITLHDELNGKEHVVEFDFLGKDSIRYNNAVSVEKRVFKNVQLFMENKKPQDDLFDRLNTSILNEYLNGLMPGLTAKVFRTFNASITLQQQLDELTDESDNVTAKMLSYNRANRAVAILCNHQRSVPKTHDKSMANLQSKIDAKKEALEQAEKEFKQAKKSHKSGSGENSKANLDKKKKAVERVLEQLNKLETQQVDKEENKTIALGTSKLNYLDPRISVAWCKKHEVPIEKVYNKTQREKFLWAIEMAGPDYEF